MNKYKELLKQKNLQKLKEEIKENPNINELKNLLNSEHKQTILNIIFTLDLSNNTTIMNKILINDPIFLYNLHKQIMIFINKNYKSDIIYYLLNIELEIIEKLGFNYESFDILKMISPIIIKNCDEKNIDFKKNIELRNKYYIYLFMHFMQMEYYFSALNCLMRISKFKINNEYLNQIKKIIKIKNENQKFKMFFHDDLREINFDDNIFINALNNEDNKSLADNAKDNKIMDNAKDDKSIIDHEDNKSLTYNNEDNKSIIDNEDNKSIIDHEDNKYNNNLLTDTEFNNEDNNKIIDNKIIFICNDRNIEFKLNPINKYWKDCFNENKVKINYDFIEFLEKNEIKYSIKENMIFCKKYENFIFKEFKENILKNYFEDEIKEEKKEKEMKKKNKKEKKENKKEKKENKKEKKENKKEKKENKKEEKEKIIPKKVFRKKYELFKRYSNLEPDYRKDDKFNIRKKNWDESFKGYKNWISKLIDSFETNKNLIEDLISELNEKLKKIQVEERKSVNVVNKSVNSRGSWRNEGVLKDFDRTKNSNTLYVPPNMRKK